MGDKRKCFGSDDLRVCEVRVRDLPAASVDALCRCNDRIGVGGCAAQANAGEVHSGSGKALHRAPVDVRVRSQQVHGGVVF